MRPRTNPATNAMATMTATAMGRRVKTSAPVGPCSVRTPISSEARPKAMIANTTAFLSAAIRSTAGLAPLSVSAATAGSDLLDFRPAENAGRQEDQHDDENREG